MRDRHRIGSAVGQLTGTQPATGAPCDSAAGGIPMTTVMPRPSVSDAQDQVDGSASMMSYVPAGIIAFGVAVQ